MEPLPGIAGCSGLLTDLLILGILTEKPRDLQTLRDGQKLANRTYIFKKSITLLHGAQRNNPLEQLIHLWRLQFTVHLDPPPMISLVL